MQVGEQELRLRGRKRSEGEVGHPPSPPPAPAPQCVPLPVFQVAQKYTEPSLSPRLSNFWICALRCLSLLFR